MKQLAVDRSTGEFSIAEVPAPVAGPGQLLVRTRASAVSVGTEKQTLDFAQRSLLRKALARPDLVRQVIAKVRAEGIGPAWRASKARLDAPVALGYASAGIVEAVGTGVVGFAPGDRVACSGQGHAGHAELVVVPASLCAHVPDGLDDESASFAAIGGIAIHAIRHARARPGDRVAVIGLGLLGQIAVQALHAWGIRVFATDVSPSRVELARGHGAEAAAVSGPDTAAQVHSWAGDAGCRAAIILAATPSNGPLELAAAICGERGRVVAAGLVGLDIPRAPFFEKELELVVPRAWGAGSLPNTSPSRVLDEPDAKANLEEFLSLVAKGGIRLDQLITHRFPFGEARAAYALITEGREPYLGVALGYHGEPDTSRNVEVAPATRRARPTLGVIGAGMFARGVILPLLEKREVRLRVISTTRPVDARAVATRVGFERAATTPDEVFDDDSVEAVLILTRHDSHAQLTMKALAAGKKVFVEKPLATTPDELAALRRTYAAVKDPLVVVGFNRRYAPATRFIREALVKRQGPFAIHCTVNAGKVESHSWINDPVKGGGRIIGEACHFIDLASALTGARPTHVSAFAMGGAHAEEDVSIQLRLSDGSVASILYVTSGSKSYPRETIDVIGGGLVARIENFRRATIHAGGRTTRWSASGVDRGHAAELDHFLRAARDPRVHQIDFGTDIATTAATFAAVRSMREEGRMVPIEEVLL